METIEYSVTIKKASEGMFLTQKAEVLQEHESRLFVKQITVTPETDNNYREATLEEKEAYEASLQENLNQNGKNN